MNTDVAGVREGDTLRQAGHRMRELGVAVLPVYGADGRRQGTVSRDMIVRRIAVGGDPRVVTVGELAPVPVPPRPPQRARAALTARPPAGASQPRPARGGTARPGTARPDRGEQAPGTPGVSAPRTPGWLP